MLSAVEIESGQTIKKSIIWLHGLGADGHDFVPITKELQLPSTLAIRFIFPHAPLIPVTINNGYVMRAWYDVTSLTNISHIDKPRIIASISSIESLIEKEVSRGLQSNDIFLAGFSQGAVIALTAGLRFQKPLAGIIALSGYFPLAEETLSLASANTHLPIFLAHGTEDPVVPFILGEMAYQQLVKANYPVDWHSYPMPHSVCAAEIKDISQWISAHDKK